MTSNQKMRRKREAKKRKKREANERKRVKIDSESNRPVTSTKSDDAGPSDQSREPRLEPPDPFLEPKHKIFLSHSGAQKDFTWQLCEDLGNVSHYPFFDRRNDSLPKGEKFPPLIIDAAQNCRLAVVVISDEFFTRSKWPMTELNEFVKAQGSTNPDLKILPLFLGISMEQFKEKERQDRWFGEWQKMAGEDGRIDVESWKVALSKIPGGINAMEYSGLAEGEVEFRKKVVAAICKLVPPDVKYDVSHVKSMERLCEPIKKRLEEVEPSENYKVRVVGLHGMGGVGKTTISKALCNQMFGDFCGKVCHIELGGNDMKSRKKVLRELTGASSEILNNDKDKLSSLLKERMHHQKVFLVLDNLWDDQVEEAQNYLKVGYHDGSMVLVTSRSKEVLCKRLQIEEHHCLQMPNLEDDGAIDVFLSYVGISKESIKDLKEFMIIIKCIRNCCFSSKNGNDQGSYLPLALKALGSQLGSIGHNILRWEQVLEKVEFNMLRDKKHPIFSVLRVGYDALNEKDQHIFLDLALVWICKWRRWFGKVEFLWDWLCRIHKSSSHTETDMKASVDALVRKGLLDKVIDMEVLDFTIHDLYIEFAEAEAVAGPLQQRRFFIDKDKEQASTLPRELMKMPNLERLIIHRSGIQNLEGAKLHLCKNVEVLDLQYCNALKVVDVTNMENLRCLVVIKCDMLDNWKGVEKLNELAILYWVGKVYDRQSVSSEFAQNLSSLTALQVLKLENLLWSRIDSFPPNLSNCADLQELTISNYSFMGRSKYYLLVDFGAHLPTSVKKIDLSNCDVHMGRSPICSMSSLTNLQDLNLNTCIEIEDLTGLCELKSLERLIVVHTSICEIPGDMWKLKQLHFLDVSLCSKLKNLNGISQAPALQHLKASFCENLEELSPNDLIGFTQLQYLNVSRCRQLKSIVCIMHATALQQLDASECGSLRELPNDFSGLKNLKMLDLSWDESICKLPENYKSLAAHHEREGTLEGCWGLIVPLVEKLRGADMARVQCDDACHSECDSMEAWMEARKKFDSAAYHLLKQIIPPRDDEPGVEFLIDNWEYRLDASEVKDATIRALCEHDSRGGLVSNMLANVLEVLGYHTWWVVVATAPCTLAAVTKKAMLEPRRETLLHYTIEQIICTYQWTCWSRIIREDGTFDMRWDGESETYDALFFSSVKNGIMAVLQKCREKLEEAIVQGIDPVRSNEGKKVVDTLLREMEAATRQELAEDSILKQGIGDYKGMRYSDLFPNFPFEQILGSEFVRPNFPFEQILGSEFVRLH